MESCKSHCHELGIPEEFHTKLRTIDSTFSAEELLFMRHPRSEISDQKALTLPNYHCHDQSVNRSRYGTADSVLYNTEINEHYQIDKTCILSFAVGPVEETRYINENTKEVRDGKLIRPPDVYTLKVAHVPTECMYPHSEIQLYKNGELVEASGRVSKSAKTWIRNRMAEIVTLYK